MTTALRLLTALVTAATLAGCAPTGNQGADQQALDQAARAAVRLETAVTPADLADRLVRQSGDFVLLDLRDPADYAAMHIESASTANLPELVGADARADLPSAKDVILYGADGSVGPQAAALLRLAGIERAYFLQGGYAGWLAHLTGPVEVAPGDREAAQEAAKRAAIACRFEGDYVAAAGLVPKAPAGAYKPATTPATAPQAAGGNDGLGLGLGLGLGPATPAPAGTTADSSGLGLGLGLGLGPEGAAPAPSPGRLNIGEGC
jgi:rhodanese-related sulfurtransferase